MHWIKGIFFALLLWLPHASLAQDFTELLENIVSEEASPDELRQALELLDLIEVEAEALFGRYQDAQNDSTLLTVSDGQGWFETTPREGLRARLTVAFLALGRINAENAEQAREMAARISLAAGVPVPVMRWAFDYVYRNRGEGPDLGFVTDEAAYEELLSHIVSWSAVGLGEIDRDYRAARAFFAEQRRAIFGLLEGAGEPMSIEDMFDITEVQNGIYFTDPEILGGDDNCGGQCCARFRERGITYVEYDRTERLCFRCEPPFAAPNMRQSGARMSCSAYQSVLEEAMQR